MRAAQNIFAPPLGRLSLRGVNVAKIEFVDLRGPEQ